jgi:hypothetical protein
LVEKALEAKGLAAPEAVRWYKKDGRGRERYHGGFPTRCPPSDKWVRIIVNGIIYRYITFT